MNPAGALLLAVACVVAAVNAVDVTKMTVTQLQTALRRRGVAYADCFERSELVVRLQENWHLPASSPSDRDVRDVTVDDNDARAGDARSSISASSILSSAMRMGRIAAADLEASIVRGDAGVSAFAFDLPPPPMLRKDRRLLFF